MISFDDASTRVRPWTFGMRLAKDDTPAGLRGILSAARTEEREAAQGK